MNGGSLERILSVAANAHRESVRERVLYNLLFFAVLMTFSGLILGQLSIRQDEKILKDIGLASMDVFGLLIAIFIGMGLVAKEIERRSLYPLLAKPVTRAEFLVGKFLGLCFTLCVNVAIMLLGLFATLLATGRGLDPSLLKVAYATWLGLAVTTAIALMFSALTSTPLAAICTFSVVVVGRFSDVIKNMRDVLPDVPEALILLVYYGVPNFRNFDIKNRVVYGDPVSMGDLGVMTLYAALYCALAIGIAVSAFRGRDL